MKLKDNFYCPIDFFYIKCYNITNNRGYESCKKSFYIEVANPVKNRFNSFK